jgi:hypothetical protein
MARRETIPVELKAIGAMESLATVNVKSQVAGELIHINFSEGQRGRGALAERYRPGR